jgi:alpha-D-ribose 1-methylphosphonate 5-phosphate C-P lyase
MTKQLESLIEHNRTSITEGYNYAFLDENTKREVRRAVLKAVAIPGYQVPFGSREMPLAKGWGTGGIQITLSVIGPGDVLKVIDQGCDESLNSSNIRRLTEQMAAIESTVETARATVIQTRHRIPEEPLTDKQILILQVPMPEPLRHLEPYEEKTRQMHAKADYSKMWLFLYENIVVLGKVNIGAGYPVMVNGRYIMSPSPIPRWDIPKLDMAEALFLFGAGREKRIYAVPPYTQVKPLEFEDYPFEKEDFSGKSCCRCGSTESYLDEVFDSRTGEKRFCCSDTAFCAKRAGGEV